MYSGYYQNLHVFIDNNSYVNYNSALTTLCYLSDYRFQIRLQCGYRFDIIFNFRNFQHRVRPTKYYN